MGNSLITSLKMLTVVGGIDVSEGFLCERVCRLRQRTQNGDPVIDPGLFIGTCPCVLLACAHLPVFILGKAHGPGYPYPKCGRQEST